MYVRITGKQPLVCKRSLRKFERTLTLLCITIFLVGKFLSLEVSKYILLNVGDEFCNLVKREEEAFSWQTKKGEQLLTKRRLEFLSSFSKHRSGESKTRVDESKHGRHF